VDTSSAKFKCIQIEDCGCTDGDGNTYGGITLSLFLVLTGRSQVPAKSFGCKGNRNKLLGRASNHYTMIGIQKIVANFDFLVVLKQPKTVTGSTFR